MEIEKVKIENKLMTEIVNTLFGKQEKMNNGKTLVTIKEHTIESFIKEYSKQTKFLLGNTLPYISLVSENANNELKVYLSQHNEYKITVNDISLKTNSFSLYNNKYTFTD